MDKREFNSIEKLYHYTTFDNAIKILLSRKLRFGMFNKMNDINESYRSVFYDIRHNILEDEIENEILKAYQQFSLTSDYYKRAGYNIPAMWGHYADKGKGVCLVFDKNKLLECLDETCWHRSVIYKNKISNHIIIDKSNIYSCFSRNKNKIFFNKTIDWKYEQEYRIIKVNVGSNKNDNYFLPYGNSLVSVILCYDDIENKNSESIFNSLKFKMLNEISNNIIILEYASFLGKVSLIDCNGNDWLINDFDTAKLNL